MYEDSNGNFPFLALTSIIGAVAGAIIGGVSAACSGGNVWAGAGIGAAVGGLVGLGAGAAAGALLAGSATASTASVVAGASVLLNQAGNAISTVLNKASKVINKGGRNVASKTQKASDGACFVAGTSILASGGLVAVESIRAGDKVWAENPETGEKAIKEVVQTFVRETDELVHISIDSEVITSTLEHPFYVPQKGWMSAIQLRAGDILVLSNGKYVTVEKIQYELLETPVNVYNFEVADFHTYYVGENSVLVHNACSMPKKQASYPGRKSAFKAAKREIGIPNVEQPTSVLPNIGRNGQVNPGRVYQFRNNPDLFIRDDVIGHTFTDGTSMSRHFNTSNLHIFY